MPFPLHQYVLGVSVLWIHFYDFETILGRAAMVYHRPASQGGKISNISHKSRIVLLDCSRWSCLANMVVHSNFTMYYFYSNCIETFFFSLVLLVYIKQRPKVFTKVFLDGGLMGIVVRTICQPLLTAHVHTSVIDCVWSLFLVSR